MSILRSNSWLTVEPGLKPRSPHSCLPRTAPPPPAAGGFSCVTLFIPWRLQTLKFCFEHQQMYMVKEKEKIVLEDAIGKRRLLTSFRLQGREVRAVRPGNSFLLVVVHPVIFAERLRCVRRAAPGRYQHSDGLNSLQGTEDVFFLIFSPSADSKTWNTRLCLINIWSTEKCTEWMECWVSTSLMIIYVSLNKSPDLSVSVVFSKSRILISNP